MKLNWSCGRLGYLNVGWGKEPWHRWLEIAVGRLPSLLYVCWSYDDQRELTWQCGRMRRKWCWHGGWHLQHVLTYHTPTQGWRTLWYDGYYQRGDWVSLPPGQEWQSGQQVAVDWR